MSSQRISPSEQRALEQRWLTERFEGICVSDFGDDNVIRFYFTADLSLPEQFNGHYHVCTPGQNSRFQLSSQEGEGLHKVDALFVFCNIHDPAQIVILQDIASELDLKGNEAPPLYLVIHTVPTDCPRKEGIDNCLRELVMSGIDGIISADHAGHALVWDARLILTKARCLSNYFSLVLKEHRAETTRAINLAECIEVTMWGYLPARLAPSLPAVDHTLIRNQGKHVIHGLELGRRMGEGMSGAVYQLCRKGVASGSVVKMQPKTSINRISDLRILKRTISMSQRLSTGACAHPSIVKLQEVLHSPTHILLLMEDAGPENLYQYLVQKNLPAEKAKSILTQALAVLEHLHNNSICHRDLKPENFIMCDEKNGITLKLVDFDMAVEMKSGTMCSSSCGTIPFMAPEVLLDEEYDGFQADLWSMGLVMCEVLLGVRSLENKLSLTKVVPLKGETPSHAVARVIKDFFQPAGVVLNFVGDSCHRQFRHLLAVCSPILCGMLRVQAQHRWDASMCYYKLLEL